MTAPSASKNDPNIFPCGIEFLKYKIIAMGPYTINQQLLGTIDSFKLIGFNPQELLKGFT